MDLATLAEDDKPVDRQVSAADFLERVRLPTLEAPLGTGQVFKRPF